MACKVYLKYPCGKLFEIRVPIAIIDEHGKQSTVLPGTDNYFKHAQQKFEINNLKVIERDTPDIKPIQPSKFITLSKRIRSVE